MYTAKYLKLAWEKAGTPYRIRILEKLPTPYGLVRYGVAPDHPEVKNVQHDFQTLLEQQGPTTSTSSSIEYLGNVTVGRDISLHELRQSHHAVVLATGCESDRTLDLPIATGTSSSASSSANDDNPPPPQKIPPDDNNHPSLKGILSAREFVAWYNGHPEYTHIGPLVQDALTTTTRPTSSSSSSSDDESTTTIREASVVVVGQGNVALDCARILAKGGTGLYHTDMAAHALPVLGQGVRRITVVGRRGHVQGAFTIKELRELVQLQEEGHDTDFVVRSDELDQGATPASIDELEGPGGRPKKRIDKLLRKAAASSTATSSSNKRLDLRFLLNPSAWQADKDDSSRLGGVLCERTRLEGEAGDQQAVGTGEMEEIPAQLALVSIGYKGLLMPGLDDRFFDADRGVVRHEHGRIDPAVVSSDDANMLGGLYAAGWIKRGPSGIIGTNIPDARDTVNTILQDLEDIQSPSNHEHTINDLKKLLTERGVEVVDWEAYRRIEAHEAASTRSDEQPREKITNLQEQLDVALGRGR